MRGIVRVVRKCGLNAELREGIGIDELRQALGRGDTVILNLQAWRDRCNRLPQSQTWGDGHYAVRVGMSPEKAGLDPLARETRQSLMKILLRYNRLMKPSQKSR